MSQINSYSIPLIFIKKTVLHILAFIKILNKSPYGLKAKNKTRSTCEQIQNINHRR